MAAEACVVDVLRARGVCSRPEDLLLTQTTLLKVRVTLTLNLTLPITLTLSLTLTLTLTQP